MYARRPLDVVLGAVSRVAALRTLEGHEGPLTGREIARLSGVSHQAIHSALQVLVQAGLVTRERQGRANIYQLNRAHHLAGDGILRALRAEKDYWPRIQAEIRRIFGRRAVAVILFGSAARMEEGPGSDLDLLILVQTPSGVRAARDAWGRQADRFRRRYGLGVAPLTYPLARFRRLVRSGNPLARSVLKEGRLIAGTIPTGLRHGA